MESEKGAANSPYSTRQAMMQVASLRVEVHLGVTPEEQATAQNVDFHVQIRFQIPPSAIFSDRIEDTLNYAEVCTTLLKVASARPYHLIESLAYTAFESLRELVGSQNRYEVTVHKLNPPIPGLRDGVRFTYGNL
jgi:dihydroneopterin aldolase